MQARHARVQICCIKTAVKIFLIIQGVLPKELHFMRPQIKRQDQFYQYF